MSTLLKEDEHRWDTNLTYGEIDLAHGLKGKHERIFTHTTYF